MRGLMRLSKGGTTRTGNSCVEVEGFTRLLISFSTSLPFMMPWHRPSVALFLTIRSLP